MADHEDGSQRIAPVRPLVGAFGSTRPMGHARPSATLAAISALALLASCGDDLESRQAAVQESSPEMDTVGAQNVPNDVRVSTTPAPAATAEGFADDEDASADGDGAATDASPEALIDDAQGFSPDPMDDASGFDPSPDTPQGFAPEAIEPQAVEE